MLIFQSQSNFKKMTLFIIGFCVLLCALLYLALSDSFVHLTNEQKEKELEDMRKETQEIEVKKPCYEK